MNGFYHLGAHMRLLADRFAGGSLLGVQEGGNTVSYAAFCLHVMLEGVLETARRLSDPLAYLPNDPQSARQALDNIQAAYRTAVDGARKR